MKQGARGLALTMAALLVLATGTIAGASTSAKKKSSGKLVGTFQVEAAECADGAPTSGSYFRMIQPGGTLDAGPFLPNGDSSCGDKTYSPLVPGTDGGLITGKFQPQPDPPMDAAGNGLADAILEPTKFFAQNFAVSTNDTDPQTGESVKPLSIKASKSGTLSGDTTAFSVAYGGQQFNQGAPKPDGSLPGITTKLTGTYDKKTGAYEMEWVTQIVGGPFDTFTGVWHFEGTFKAKKK
ncbi:MAG: hypothetical protein WD598_13505 [Acidimicrobiia bacterium]